MNQTGVGAGDAGRRPGPRARGDRGAAVVEFVLVGPLLFALLLGIVEFGLNLSNQIGLNQGVREAARQAAVGNFGPTASCNANLTAQGSEDMRELICLTKARSDVMGTTPSVAIRFDPTTGQPGFVAGNGILVCTATPLRSVSGLFAPILNGATIRTKAVMLIEKAPPAAESQANEADPSGQNWSWCTP